MPAVLHWLPSSKGFIISEIEGLHINLNSSLPCNSIKVVGELKNIGLIIIIMMIMT